MNKVPFHSHDIQYKNPFGAAPVGTSIAFTIKPHRKYAITLAFLLIYNDIALLEKIPLHWSSLEKGCDVYTCTYTPMNKGLFWYCFLLESNNRSLYLSQTINGKGEITHAPGSKWQLTVYPADFTTPDWLKGGVIYHIFPDRFCKYDEVMQNVPDDRDLREDWGALPDYESLETQIKMNNDYFGGNLKGITSKLDYLSDLGVTAIYLNPIFEAHSNHRYNTADYRKIDPLLGTETDFIDLCLEAEKKNIRIILDGVFNHTGVDSIFFNRFGRYDEPGAYQSQESRYFDWFNFIQWPEEYRSWWGIKCLPEINKSSNEFCDYILGNDGVVEYWLKKGAWGWRLDVADELPSIFLDQLRSVVKKVNPEAIIIGEVWEDASNKISYDERRHYLEGSELDSVMNYPFMEGVIQFIKDRDAVRLDNCITGILENYPKPVIDVLMNMLGTHDTARILTRLCGKSSLGKDRSWKAKTWLTQDERKHGLRDVAIAAAITYFLPGVPCLYYGDEIGLEGYEDPFNRRCFLWEETDGTLTDWYQKLGSIRQHCPVLKDGVYVPLQIEGGLYVFMRKGFQRSLICAVNMDETSHTLNIPFSQDNLELLASLAVIKPSSILTIPPKCCSIYQTRGN